MTIYYKINMCLFYGFSGLNNNQLLKNKIEKWIYLFNQLRNKNYLNTSENLTISHK